MKVSDVLTRNAISIEPDAEVLRAVRLMLQNRISGLPVLEVDGRLVGILTEGDLLRRQETGTEPRRSRWMEFLLGPGRLADEYVHVHGRRVREVMTTDLVTIDADATLDQVVELMQKHQIKRLPVMSDGKMVGIVSRANLLHALASLAAEAGPPVLDDERIRERIMSELMTGGWAPVSLVNVVVRNGVVDLWGAIIDDRQRKAILVAAENVPGVKEVRDHMTWIDPASGSIWSADAPQTAAVS